MIHISISALRDLHQGQPAAVLGGGPSLPADLACVSTETVLISVNHHALRLIEDQADYIVFMDKPENYPALRTALLGSMAVRVSQIKGAGEVDLAGAPYWDGGFSSTLATWLACWMGCDPVLLCGMDCYQGDQKYFYERTDIQFDQTFYYPLENHLKAWRPALQKCQHPERIKAVSGPLVQIFGEWQP
jgi:hypothetical protein